MYIEVKERYLVIIADKEHIIGIITLSDTMRNDAINMDIYYLKLRYDNSINLLVIVKKQLHIWKEIQAFPEIHAELLPGENVSIIESLQGKHHKVCMVGDGINDARL